jgi:anti-anti-sigma factor
MTNTSLYDIITVRSGAGEPELSVSALEYGHGRSCVVVSLAGRADIEDCGWLRLLLELPAAQEHGRLVLDLSRLSSMDWWVALIVIWAGRVVSRRGGVLVVASPQPAVARVLDAAGAPKAVAVCDSVQQAVGNVPACPPASA